MCTAELPCLSPAFTTFNSEENHHFSPMAANVSVCLWARRWITTCFSSTIPHWPCAGTPLEKTKQNTCLRGEWWMAYRAACAVACVQSICFLHRRELHMAARLSGWGWCSTETEASWEDIPGHCTQEQLGFTTHLDNTSHILLTSSRLSPRTREGFFSSN